MHAPSQFLKSVRLLALLIRLSCLETTSVCLVLLREQPLDSFTDVRELQRQLKSKGLVLESEAEENSEGPASFIVTDPDGNPILFDQHV